MERPTEKQFIRAANRFQARQNLEAITEAHREILSERKQHQLGAAFMFGAGSALAIHALSEVVRARFLLSSSERDERTLHAEREAEGIAPYETTDSFVSRRLKEAYVARLAARK
jgi:hypothetical protein